MGSDMHMNPPQKVYESQRGLTEEEAMEWVVGAMANKYEIVVTPGGSDTWIVKVFKGVWI